MCGTVLTEKATRLDRTSIFPLSVADKNSQEVIKMKEQFQIKLKDKLKARIAAMKDGRDPLDLEMDELATLLS